MDKPKKEQLRTLSTVELTQVWGGIKRQVLIDAIDRLDSALRTARPGEVDDRLDRRILPLRRGR